MNETIQIQLTKLNIAGLRTLPVTLELRLIFLRLISNFVKIMKLNDAIELVPYNNYIELKFLLTI